jgi:chitodextrinase
VSKLGKLGVAFIAALTLVGVVGMPAAAPAPIVFSPTPIAGWSTNGIVKAVLVVGDTVYAGGTFTQVQSTDGTQTLARANLAAFDLHSGAVRTGFSADTNGRVLSLATDGARLFAGGDYTMIGGKSHTRLASLDLTTGAVSSVFTGGATSNIYALRVKGTRLYVGGSFGTLNGVTRPRIGAVDTTTGAVDPSFNPAADNTVHSIVTSPDGSTVYVGGDFVNIGGAAHSYLAAVTAATGAATTTLFQYPNIFDPTQPPSVEDIDISPSGDRVFAALAGLENQVASWSTSTGQKQWSYVVDGDTQAVRYYQGNVYFGFHEGAINDDTVRMLSVDAATGALNSWRPTENSFFGTWDIDVSPATNTLVVGGEFTNFNGVNTHGVALLPPASSDTVAPGPPSNLRVTSTTGTTINLAWNAGTDNTTVAGYRVLRDGVEVAYPTGLTYSDTFLNPSTNYSYTVQTVDAAGNLSTPTAPVIGGTDQALLAAGSVWKYLDNGSNQGTAWRATAFNDSTWAAGASELGYGDGDEATVVGYGGNANSKYWTTYFRQQFTIDNPGNYSNLNLSLLRDDGAVVYLNGTEVARSNMPTGTVTSTTAATANVDGAAESQWFPYTAPSSLLVAGTNTIAVEIHQQYRASSDISFNLSMSATRRQGPTPPTALTAGTVTGTTVPLSWTPPSGTITGYHVFRNGVLVGSPATASFTDAGLNSAQTYTYTVTAIDDHTLESQPSAALNATTLDIVAPTAPTAVTAPTVGAAHVVVSWTAATDNVGVTGYDLVRDGVVVASTTGATTANDTTVAPLSSYSYTVRAKDAAGNSSVDSAPLPVTTPDGSDFVPPSVPQNLRTTSRSTTQIALAWDASTDDTGVASYIVTRNGVDLPATTSTTLTDTALTPATTYTYTVRATDAALNASNASTALATATHATTETLVAAKAVWKYTDDGIDRGTAWRAFTYNDTTWKSGAGILGYNQGGEGTVLNNGGAVQNLRYISHYFRKSITVSDTAAITGLTLSLLRTDGAVVYVNGVEVARDNMPTGTINFDTYAVNVLSTAERAQQIYHPFVIPPSALQEGTNVIAVSVHHAWRGGTDALSFDMQLTATYQ